MIPIARFRSPGKLAISECNYLLISAILETPRHLQVISVFCKEKMKRMNNKRNISETFLDIRMEKGELLIRAHVR